MQTGLEMCTMVSQFNSSPQTLIPNDPDNLTNGGYTLLHQL